MTKTVKKGDTVLVHYTGKLEDGTVFDSSFEREPLKVSVGAEELIPGFEKEILGMEKGQIKSIKILPKDAYGLPDTSLVKEIDRKFLPKEFKAEVGMRLQLGEGQDITIVTVTRVTDSSITLDANHPLAGHTLNFDLQVMDIL